MHILIFDFPAAYVLPVEIEYFGKRKFKGRSLVYELTWESRNKKYFW